MNSVAHPGCLIRKVRCVAQFVGSNAYLIIPSLVGFTFLALFLQRYTSRGEVVIRLTKDQIGFEWTKHSLLNQAPNWDIAISDIKNWEYREDRIYNLFRITLKNDTEVNIWHCSLFERDAFQIFQTDFRTLFHDTNLRATSKSKKLKK